MTDRQTISVEMRMSYPISNLPQDKLCRIEIKDSNSRLVLAEIEIDSAQLLELLASRQALGTARVPAARHLGRIGRRLEVGGTTFPSTGPGELDETQAGQAAQAWADAENWEEVTFGRTNRGVWSVQGRRWLPE